MAAARRGATRITADNTRNPEGAQASNLSDVLACKGDLPVVPPVLLLVGLWNTPKRFCDAKLLLRCSRGCSNLQLSVRICQLRSNLSISSKLHMAVARGCNLLAGRL